MAVMIEEPDLRPATVVALGLLAAALTANAWLLRRGHEPLTSLARSPQGRAFRSLLRPPLRRLARRGPVHHRWPLRPPEAPMTKISEWRKALAAAVLGVPAWGVVAQVDGIEPVEWWGLAGVLATALVVWLVPNEAPADDRGATSWSTVALVVIAVVVVLWAFGEVPR